MSSLSKRGKEAKIELLRDLANGEVHTEYERMKRTMLKMKNDMHIIAIAIVIVILVFYSSCSEIWPTARCA